MQRKGHETGERRVVEQYAGLCRHRVILVVDSGSSLNPDALCSNRAS
jgi:hypothetical protein